MTILSLPAEPSASDAAEPKPAVRRVAHGELPPLWVFLLLPVALVLVPAYLGLHKLVKALDRHP